MKGTEGENNLEVPRDDKKSHKMAQNLSNHF